MKKDAKKSFFHPFFISANCSNSKASRSEAKGRRVFLLTAARQSEPGCKGPGMSTATYHSLVILSKAKLCSLSAVPLRIFRVVPSSESAAPAAVVLYPVCVSVTASSEHSACAAVGGRKRHLALCVCVLFTLRCWPCVCRRRVFLTAQRDLRH